MSAPTTDPLLRRLTRIKRIVLVLSGKGGVGKSSVAVQLALSLVNEGRSEGGADGEGKRARVGLLDVDLTGPSIPRMVGLTRGEVIQSHDGWVPVQLDLSSQPTDKGKGKAQEQGGSSEEEVLEKQRQTGVLECMSIGFLLKNPNDAVVWRGPKKNAMIRQFLVDVRWGDLDWLIIDTPPGTSDEHISLLEHLGPLFTTPSSPSLPLPSLTSVLVTTPQAVSLSDVSKELSFARKTHLPVLGLIENMSGYVCPHCGEVQNVFGSGGGEEFCRKDQEKVGASQDGLEGLRFLGRVPIDTRFTRLMDQAAGKVPAPGPVMVVNGRPTSTPAPLGEHHLHPNGSSAPNGASTVPLSDEEEASLNLLERYRRTPTFPIFSAISAKLVGLVLEREALAKDLAAGEGAVKEVGGVVAHV